MSSTPKVWFITGSSSGFGRSMVDLLLKKGDKVVATLRKPSDLADLAAEYPTSQLVVVKLDVTQSSDISPAFEKARQAFGRIDVVFNNAGQLVMGEVEGVPEEDARKLFDVNFWGAANITKEAVRFFRDVNSPAGGRLLQVSSLVGLVGGPVLGFYSASKFALEGLSECLARELDPAWNIKVTIIEPGIFRTKMNYRQNGKVIAQHPAYTNPTSPSSQTRASLSPEIDGDADKATAAMEKLVHLDHPPLRIPLHKQAVADVKARIQNVLDEVHAYESWSDDLYVD
ncbi:NAD(P)-binding protein [Paxillus ammoniavirescens]|nr:NAD(P)-binding protein [Paxillus ammoniavirescens]